jgi:hypothetical protein
MTKPTLLLAVLLGGPALANTLDIVGNGDAGTPLTGGNQSTLFRLQMPAGAACPSAQAGTRWSTTFMVPQGVQPETLRLFSYLPFPLQFGPPFRTFRMPLFRQVTSGANATVDWLIGNGVHLDAVNGVDVPQDQPMPIENVEGRLQDFSFGAYGPGEIPSGVYTIGILCIGGGPEIAQQENEVVLAHWSTTITVQATATGYTWVKGVSTFNPAADLPLARNEEITYVGVKTTTGVPLTRGTTTTQFVLDLPAGAACPGSTFYEDYRWGVGLVAASYDLRRLMWGPRGPLPRSAEAGDHFKVALRNLREVWNVKLTEQPDGPGLPGPLPVNPMIEFAFAPHAQAIPAGTYHAAVVCSKAYANPGHVDRMWVTRLRIEKPDAGLVEWTVLPPFEDAGSDGGVMMVDAGLSEDAGVVADAGTDAGLVLAEDGGVTGGGGVISDGEPTGRGCGCAAGSGHVGLALLWVFRLAARRRSRR